MFVWINFSVWIVLNTSFLFYLSENHVMDMCGPSGFSSITSNSTIHLRNYLYPNLGQNSRNCLCNISTLNNRKVHVLQVKAVDVLFNCSQSLVFSDQTNALKKVECEKALYGLSSVFSSRSNQPELHMRYQTLNETSIYLWVEVSGDNLFFLNFRYSFLWSGQIQGWIKSFAIYW